DREKFLTNHGYMVLRIDPKQLDAPPGAECEFIRILRRALEQQPPAHLQQAAYITGFVASKTTTRQWSFSNSARVVGAGRNHVLVHKGLRITTKELGEIICTLME